MSLVYAIGAVGVGLLGYALLGRIGRAQAANQPRRPALPRGRNRLAFDQAPVLSAPVGPASEEWAQAPAQTPGGRSREHDVADDAAAGPAPSGVVSPPSLEAWAVLLAPGCTAHGIQLPYAVQWVAMESGGNPCEVGYPPAKAPDGAPRELGIAQFYNPDDLQKIGITSAELRDYCVPGDQHEVMFRGKLVRGFSKQLRRNLTPKEMQVQADGSIRLISDSMASVTRLLTSIGAGLAWSPTRRDYWRMVKLMHGMPALLSEGLPRINAKLGRAPRDWSEFRRGLDQVTLGAQAEAKRRQGLFPFALDNAERCASVFEEKSVA